MCLPQRLDSETLFEIPLCAPCPKFSLNKENFSKQGDFKSCLCVISKTIRKSFLILNRAKYIYKEQQSVLWHILITGPKNSPYLLENIFKYLKMSMAFGRFQSMAYNINNWQLHTVMRRVQWCIFSIDICQRSNLLLDVWKISI